MQNEQQLCTREGHEGCKFTHICVLIVCEEISRYKCDKCIDNYKARYGDTMDYQEIEKFTSFFKDYTLPLIELRLKSQNGNLAKQKYLTKIYDNDFGDLVWCNDKLKEQKEILERIKNIIQDLINGYKEEIVQAQLFNKIYQQLTLNGVQSLNSEQLNILLDNQFKFINKEIEFYNELNIQLNELDQYNQFEEEEQSQNQQNIRKIQKQLRRINDYLDFQQYSIDGQEFVFKKERFKSSYNFFSKNNRYFAMYNFDFFQNNPNDCSPLKIRKQNTLDVNRQLNIKIPYADILFDPLFNYCIIQVFASQDAHFYTLRNTKQFKLIKKFMGIGSVRSFFLSNNNIIIALQYSKQLIKVINTKNELINEIKVLDFEQCRRFSDNQQINESTYASFCFGIERSIIAIQIIKQIKIYQETQKQPLLSQYLEQQKYMKFINNDLQLLTMDYHYQYCRLWQIDYSNLNIILINKIESISYFVDINELNFNISDGQGGIKIFDKNYNLWFKFSFKLKASEIPENKGLNLDRERKDFNLKLTKHIIIINGQSRSQVIKRRLITDYERLQNDY